MTIRAVPLDFYRERGYAFPADRELHRLAIEYAEKHFETIPNFADYAKVWLAVRFEEDKPVRVTGILGFQNRPDISLASVRENEAFVRLYERANGYFADNGARGADVMVYVSSTEPVERRCPNQKEMLESVGAKPADRWLVTIR